MPWFWLIGGGMFEVGFTTSLRFVDGFRNLPWTLAFLASVAVSMGLLEFASRSIPMGTAYAVWGGIGAVGTVVVGILWFAKVGAVGPRADLEPTLKAFIALVLGGLGSTRGAVLGGLALGAIEVLMSSTLPEGALGYSSAIVFAVVLSKVLVFTKSPYSQTRFDLAVDRR